MPAGPEPTDPLAAAVSARDAGDRVALITVLAVEGEAPSRPGLRLAVTDGGHVLAGTLGCSEFDTAGTELAGEILAETPGPAAAVRRRVGFGHGEERALELFAEVLEPAATVVVLADNPVGRAVVDFAMLLGRRTHLLDHRIIEADPMVWLRSNSLHHQDAVVLVDHDAPYVDEALRFALASRAGYVGILGNRRRAADTVRQLAESGVPEEQLWRLHTPVGLDIGGKAPSEIGLSIVAEIVATSYGRSGGSMRPTGAPKS